MTGFDIDKLPGLKEKQIAALGPCPVCNKPLLEGGDLTFYVIELMRAGWHAKALRRRAGLGMMLGNDTLAAVMGPDEDLAKVLDGPCKVAIHESCVLQAFHPLELMAARSTPDCDPGEAVAQPQEQRRCRVCGCTQNNACATPHGPCHWVEPDLCSNPDCVAAAGGAVSVTATQSESQESER